MLSLTSLCRMRWSILVKLLMTKNEKLKQLIMNNSARRVILAYFKNGTSNVPPEPLDSKMCWRQGMRCQHGNNGLYIRHIPAIMLVRCKKQSHHYSSHQMTDDENLMARAA